MKKNIEVYKKLRKHLHNQSIGYPSTRSGVEIRLLKHFFTPEEARLALTLNYKPNSLESILESINTTGFTQENIDQLLDSMLRKRVIEGMEKEGEKYVYLVPLIIGMYEGQLNKLTPEFLQDFEKYISSTSFGLEFLSSEISQMRTIPVRESIPVEHHISNYDHITDIIQNTEGPIVVKPCICRERKSVHGEPCTQTKLKETCFSFGEKAKYLIGINTGRIISKDEALDIIRQCETDGLVFQPSNNQKVEIVCACCGCCCGMLSVQKMLPKPLDFWSSNYYSEVDTEKCTGCGKCEERCPVNAVYVDTPVKTARINLLRCIGCGICVATCPSQAISLCKKEYETVPPIDREDLYESIKANRKGTWGKIKLAARIALKR